MRSWPALVLLASACGDEGGAHPPPEPVAGPGVHPAAESRAERSAHAPEPFRFVDVTHASGLGGFQQRSGDPAKGYIVETVGGGVALVDVDLDGDLDAYLTNGSFFGATAGDAPRDALYLNDGAGTFRDATEASGLGDRGWTCGVRVVDFDADGWPDLYLTNYGPNVLYRNDGDGTFTDVTAAAGVGDPGWSTGACFLDHDNDGDLDLYVANYLEFDEARFLAERPTIHYQGVEVMQGPRGLPEAYDTFYVNRGDGTFRDASEELGVRAKKLFGFQCVAFDADRDGWVDVYVANDSVENLLWHNREGSGFEDRAFLTGLALSMAGKPQAGMGVALGDYDGDLVPDLYVTNFADDYFTLYRGTPRNYWVDATHRLRLADVTRSALGWGCGFEDLDSDGDLEIFVAAGHVYPQVDEIDVGSTYRQQNLLLAYDGATFERVAGGPGFELAAASRGAAVGDVDADGDLDLLFGNLDGPPTLLRNDTPQGNALRLLLVGRGGNREAVGARVVVTVGERRHLRLVATAQGFLSSSSPWLHVGLGDAERADAVDVTWPDGTTETLGPVAAGGALTIVQGAASDGAARTTSPPR